LRDDKAIPDGLDVADDIGGEAAAVKLVLSASKEAAVVACPDQAAGRSGL
jgi:hypothetical protein